MDLGDPEEILVIDPDLVEEIEVGLLEDMVVDLVVVEEVAVLGHVQAGDLEIAVVLVEVPEVDSVVDLHSTDEEAVVTEVVPVAAVAAIKFHNFLRM